MTVNKRKLIENIALIRAGVPLIAMYSNAYSETVLEPHDHGSLFEICYLKRGAQKYYIGKDEYTVNGGEVFVVFPREKHSTGSVPQTRGCLYWLQLDSRCDNLLGLDAESSELLISCLYSLKNRLIRIKDETAAKLVKAYNLADRGGELDLIAAKALLTTFIFELADSETKAREISGVSEPISRVRDYIEEHIKEPVNISALADLLNFSLSHFKFKFKKEIGMPPGEYVMQRKIYRSIPQLAEQSLTFIAYEYNFSSSQHYSKNFKAVTGMTPKEYRAKMKNENKA